MNDDRYSDYKQGYGMDNSYEKRSYDGQDYPSDYKKDYSSYDKDRDYDKSKDSKSVSIKILKCNNINANLNNIDANIGSSPVDGDTTGQDSSVGESLAAQGGETISGNDDKSFINREINFAFICINNNNNVFSNETTLIPPEQLNCETCFTTILTEDELNAIIADFEVEGIDSLQDICNFVDANSQTEEGRSNIAFVLANAFSNAEVSLDLLNNILECFEEVYGGIFPRVAS
jgi:hypothetical protein